MQMREILEVQLFAYPSLGVSDILWIWYLYFWWKLFKNDQCYKNLEISGVAILFMQMKTMPEAESFPFSLGTLTFLLGAYMPNLLHITAIL